jgi:hypothetical protein
MGGLDEGNLPCVPAIVCRPNDAPTMLFSDDPESPSSDGVLYADSVGPGRFRIYVYHANGGAAARKFPVVLLNQGAADAHVTIMKKGLATPSTDYVGVGKSVAAAWLGSSLSDVVTVPSQTRVLLDSALDAEHAAQNELVHAIYDVSLDAPVKISFVSVGVAEDAPTVTAGLSLLADDTLHDRGTFPGANIDVFAYAAPGARHLRFGDNVTEDDLAGVDATSGAKKALGGNYGVLYTFRAMPTTPLVLAASPRGGEWGGVALTAPAATPVLLPSTTSSLSSTTSAVWIDEWAAGTAIQASFVTAGGSNLPLDLVVIPK